MIARRLIKETVRLIIDCDGNPVTIIIRLSKRQVYELLDRYLPDDEPAK